MATLVDSYTEGDSAYHMYTDWNAAVGQSFTGDGGTLDKVTFNLRKVSSPTGNAVAKIYAHTGTYGTSSEPTGAYLAISNTVLDVSTLGAAYTEIDFTFTGGDKITLTNGTKYIAVLEYNDGGNSSNYVLWNYDNTSPTHDGNACWTDDLSAWTPESSDDGWFQVWRDDSTTSTSSSSSTSTTSSSSSTSTTSSSSTSTTSSSSSTSSTSTTLPANTHCVEFIAASSEYAYCNDNADVSVTGDISIEAWIKFDQLPSSKGSNMAIVSKWDQANKRSFYFNAPSGTDGLRLYATDDGQWNAGHYVYYDSVTTFDSGDLNTWIHVAVTFDISSETCYMYINGTEETPGKTGSIGATIYDGDTKFAIGAAFDTGSAAYYFDGRMDEVRLWDDVRTEAEIQDNRCIELVGDEANLVGYWTLDTDYVDSAKSSDLTAVGTPTFEADYPSCFDATTSTSSSSSSTSTTSSSSSTSTTSSSSTSTTSSSSSTSTTSSSSSTSTTSSSSSTSTTSSSSSTSTTSSSSSTSTTSSSSTSTTSSSSSTSTTSSSSSTSTTSSSSSTSTTSSSSSTSTTSSSSTSTTSSSSSTSTTSSSSSTSTTSSSSSTSTTSSSSSTSTTSSSSSSTSTTSSSSSTSTTSSSSSTSTTSSSSSSTSTTSSSSSTSTTSSSSSTSTTSSSSSTSTTSSSSTSTTSSSSSTSTTSSSSSTSTTSSSSSTSTTSSSSTSTTSSSSSTSTTSSSSSTSTTSSSSSTSTTSSSSSTSTTSSSSSTSTTSSSSSTSTTSSSSSTSTTSSSSSTSTTSSSSTSTTSSSSSTSTTSSSSSTSTTSSSSSTSTTTTIDPIDGGLAFGEENPVMGETASSWALWSDGAGGAPTITGDADWGKLSLDLNDEGRSKVYDFSDSNVRTITLTENRYGAGSGTATLQMRGSDDTLFTQDEGEPPAWENYTVPVAKTWRYIQVREIKTA